MYSIFYWTGTRPIILQCDKHQIQVCSNDCSLSAHSVSRSSSYSICCSTTIHNTVQSCIFFVFLIRLFEKQLCISSCTNTSNFTASSLACIRSNVVEDIHYLCSGSWGKCPVRSSERTRGFKRQQEACSVCRKGKTFLETDNFQSIQ